MDATIPWSRWAGLIEPFTYSGHRGRKPKALETMLRMYLLQAWFSLSDEGVEDAIYDSYAMRRFLGLDFTVEQVPDATTLLHFRHLLEKHQLGRKLLESRGEIFEEQGWIMRGGTIVDATIIAAPSPVKNAAGARDPEMRQAVKGNQWYFGMKAHIGVDAGAGYVHSVTVTSTAASVHDLDQITPSCGPMMMSSTPTPDTREQASAPTSPMIRTCRRSSSGSRPASRNWLRWPSRIARRSRARHRCGPRSSTRRGPSLEP
jgi:IS5 family transposase